MTYRVLDLFSGIGGFSLGLERTGGFETVAFCELDPFCRRVLAKHWPKVPCYEDVRELTAERLAADGIGVDVICGGFPCQDISVAGKGAGLGGERSGLWSEIARLSRELRPRFLIVENVSALLNRGLDRVLGDLAEVGFDAEWHCIPASAIGAPHRRDRFWLVAHPCDGRQRRVLQSISLAGGGAEADIRSDGETRLMADASRDRRAEGREDADRVRSEEGGNGSREPLRGCAGLADACGPDVEGQRGVSIGTRSQFQDTGNGSWWGTEPDVGRVAHGVPSRVDRLRSLGNAVVPQIPELIGRAILASDQARAA